MVSSGCREMSGVQSSPRPYCGTASRASGFQHATRAPSAQTLLQKIHPCPRSRSAWLCARATHAWHDCPRPMHNGSPLSQQGPCLSSNLDIVVQTQLLGSAAAPYLPAGLFLAQPAPSRSSRHAPCEQVRELRLQSLPSWRRCHASLVFRHGWLWFWNLPYVPEVLCMVACASRLQTDFWHMRCYPHYSATQVRLHLYQHR